MATNVQAENRTNLPIGPVSKTCGVFSRFAILQRCLSLACAPWICCGCCLSLRSLLSARHASEAQWISWLFALFFSLYVNHIVYLVGSSRGTGLCTISLWGSNAHMCIRTQKEIMIASISNAFRYGWWLLILLDPGSILNCAPAQTNPCPWTYIRAGVNPAKCSRTFYPMSIFLLYFIFSASKPA